MSVAVQGTFAGFGLSMGEKVSMAIGLLQMWERRALELDPERGYWGCDSGGKDSCCIRQLAKEAGVKVVWHYNVTTIDPPEVCAFIRQVHRDTVWERRSRSFFKVMVEERGFPLRHIRWCCQEFKEHSGVGKVRVTGVRWEESPRRREMWKGFQGWDPRRSHGDGSQVSWMCNPLIAWTRWDVWAFIRDRGIPYCELYDDGVERVGCVGCPMSGPQGIEREFARWPAIAKGWSRAFEELWKRKEGLVMARGKRKGTPWPGIPGVGSWEELFEWWKTGHRREEVGSGCQLGLF